MRIGLIPIISDVHNEGIVNKSLQLFLSEIENNIGLKLEIITIGEINDFDLTLVLVKTGGSERDFLKIYDKIPKPIYIISYFKNNSLAASMEILSYIKSKGISGELITGTPLQIANRLRKIINVSKLIKKLKNTRIGIIGKPSDWLIASNIDYNKISKRFGVEFIDIPIDELEKEVSHAKENINIANNFIKSARNIIEPDKKEILKATKVYNAISKILEKYHLSIFTIRCFDLIMNLKVTGCFALSLFNDIGVVAGCEGDIPSLMSMYIGRELTGQANFMANPSFIDKEKNEITFGHCTIPLSMTREYIIRNHFETGLSLGIQGIVSEGKISILKIGGKDLDKIFYSNGELLENRNSQYHCRTQLHIKPEKSVNYFLKYPLGNHHIIIKSNIEDEINILAQYLKLTLID